MFKYFLQRIMNGEHSNSQNPKKEISRPCPSCSEELERMDRCLNCNCNLTYYNGLCYEVDQEESL